MLQARQVLKMTVWKTASIQIQVFIDLRVFAHPLSMDEVLRYFQCVTEANSDTHVQTHIHVDSCH